MKSRKKKTLRWLLAAMALVIISLCSAVTVLAAGLPAPAIKSVTENNWKAVRVTWTKVKKAKEYEVYYQEGERGEKEYKLFGKTSDTACLVPVSYGEEYSFKVKAVNGNSKSDFSGVKDIRFSARTYSDAYNYLAKTVAKNSNWLTGRLADSFSGKRGKEIHKIDKKFRSPVKGKVRIYCDKKTRELRFEYAATYEMNKYTETYTCKMNLKPSMVKNTKTESPVTVTVTIEQKEKSQLLGGLKGRTSFKMDQFTLERESQFEYDSRSGGLNTDGRAQQAANGVLSNAMDEWQRLLIKDTAMALDDIGFVKLDNMSFETDK